MPEYLQFPDSFLWGTATSAYQIEGACDADGRGPSIWDTFVRMPGKIRDGSNGDQAVEFYKHWQDDVKMMANMGMQSFRFSISWPRVMPNGTGEINQTGLDFYDRLVDELLKHNIQPMVTLFHWDSPQALQDLGGWPRRDTAYAFAEYASVIAKQLGDRVPYWITHNEPFVAAFAGHFSGEHAPGFTDPLATIQTSHHLLLSHGLAVQSIRSAITKSAKVGITLNLTPVQPAALIEADHMAAALFDAAHNRTFLDPIFKGSYPEEMRVLFSDVLEQLPAEDMETIRQPLDFLGINYYTRSVVCHDPSSPQMQIAQVHPVGRDYSQMWEIYPEGMYETICRVWKEYNPTEIYITENGIPVADGIDLDGRVRDGRRIAYYRDHIAQVHKAMNSGAPVKGYLAWSLMDNFEWAYGYEMRFGLVYVDYPTQARTIKDSGHWFSNLIRSNRLELPGC